MSGRLRIDGKAIPANAESTLFQLADSVGLQVPTSCNAQGKCRECLVEIDRGGDLLSPPTAAEEHLPENFRLSCQATVVAPTGIVHCHTLRRGGLRIAEHSSGLGDTRREDDEPLFRCRDGVVERDGQLFAQIDDGPMHGLAIDLGTTTVVCRLLELGTGHTVATQSFENPQRFGGSDVMARIRYDSDHPGRLLQRVLLGYLRRAIRALPCQPESILEIVVAGNPTMRDLLFGLDVRSIGQLPYRSVTEHEMTSGCRQSTGLEIRAASLRLPAHPDARLIGLPLLGSHVGADAAACLLATGLADRDEVSMCVDIGTNTEVLLGNRQRVLVASCPAGPAFEGGGVRCGVPGLEGAIERVEIDAGQVRTQVIGDLEPIGICGSGLVDLLAELRRTGRMNAQGRLQGGDGLPSDEPFTIDDEHGIVLSEPDINELAQAKGANAAGVRIVADRYGIELGQIDRFYLAGGFGRYLDTAKARSIGLIPDLPAERIVQVGNASLAGAALALVSRTARQRLEALVQRVEHVELELHPQFFDFFVDGCQFEPFGGSTP